MRVANNLFENINGSRFGSNGAFLTVINGTEDVTIEHNTAIQTGNIIIADYAPNSRFVYRDNITRHNQYGIIGSGHGIGNDSISYYFPGSVITVNVIAKEVDAPWNVDLIYPTGNYAPASLDAVGFVDWKNGNYRLASSSRKGAGTGGTDPGCNIDALNAALNGYSVANAGSDSNADADTDAYSNTNADSDSIPNVYRHTGRYQSCHLCSSWTAKGA